MAGLCGRLGMSKFGTFGEYPKEGLASAEAALLTAWRSLERYHDDLALVGGLAVHYITKRNVAGLPGAVTMDVDFGISLVHRANSTGQSNQTWQGWASSPRAIGWFANMET